MEKNVPIDPKGNIAAAGHTLFSQELVANGNWQPVILTNECKRLLIQCDDGGATYTHADNPTEFHFCANSDGTGRGWTHQLELNIAEEIGDTICYVRATSSLVFSITGLQ